MAQLNITLNLEELTEAVMNSDMNAMMKSLAVTVFNAYMEVERDRYIKAENYERTSERKDQRNGYYERDLMLNIGSINLKVPRTRSGEFKTDVFNSYQRMDKAFVLGMIEMVITGVSTRKVTKIVEQLCGENVSKSFVSDIMQELDPQIEAFKQRSLSHSKFRYLYVDAMYIKVREDNRVVSKAVYIAQGVNDINKREIVGFMVSEEETEAAWSRFFLDLRSRGLQTPTMVISDAHAGLKKAIRKVFVGTIWQRCTFHFIRNIIDVMPKKNSKEERKILRKILQAPTQQHARELKQAYESQLKDNPKYTEALKVLDNGFEDAIQYMLEPEAFHVSLRTTNSVERLNREIRRRDRVIGIYPNIASAERLIGSILIDFHENWENNARTFLQV